MKIIPISIQLPVEVAEFYELLLTKDADAFIAGGFLFDLYHGSPGKEVDFFVHTEKIHEVIELIRGCTLDFKQVGINVYEWTYQTTRMKLLPTQHGPSEILCFDIRLMEMFYSGDQAYATDAALDDAAAKTIVIHNPVHPIRSLLRALQVEQSYGFTLEEASKELLSDQISYEDVSPLSLPEIFEIKPLESPPFDRAFYATKTYPRPVLDRIKAGTIFQTEAVFEYRFNPFIKHQRTLEGEMRTLLRKLIFRCEASKDVDIQVYQEVLRNHSPGFIKGLYSRIMFRHKNDYPNMYSEYKRLRREYLKNIGSTLSFTPSAPALLTNRIAVQVTEHLPLAFYDGYEEDQVVMIHFAKGSVYANMKCREVRNGSLDSILYAAVEPDILSFVDSVWKNREPSL